MKKITLLEDQRVNQKIELPCYPAAQQLLIKYIREASSQSESQRIHLSQKLYMNWISKKLPQKLFPGFPERNDYWFLVQLLSLHRYWLNDHDMLDFDLAKPKTILLPNSFETEDYCERNIAERKIQKINSVTSTESIGKNNWIAQLPQYDDLLRLSTLVNFQISSKLLYLRGCRKRSDGTLNGLIGGNPSLGGWQYIDALPTNTLTKKISFSHYFVLQSAKL